MKKASFVHQTKALFSVIFAFGEFYCVAVIMSAANNKVLPAGQVLILRCAQFEGEYNITLRRRRKI